MKRLVFLLLGAALVACAAGAVHAGTVTSKDPRCQEESSDGRDKVDEDADDADEETFSKANDLLQKGKYREAIPYYTRLLADEPGNADYLTSRADCYLHLSNIAASISDYMEVVRRDRDDSFSVYMVGFLYYLLPDSESSLEWLNKALKLDPTNHLAYDCRGFVYLDMGEYDLALADFTNALRCKPGYDETYLGLALACMEKGALQEARAYYKKAADLNPVFKKTASDMSEDGFWYTKKSLDAILELRRRLE